MLRYSTEGVHPRDRLASWIEVVTKTCVKHSFRSHTGSSFEGRMRGSELAGLCVGIITCSAMEAERTALDISDDHRDEFLLRLQLEGRSVCEQHGQQVTCRKNGFVLIDTARPFLITAPVNVTVLSISIPRPALEARLGATSALSGWHMEGRHALVRLVGAFLASLPDQIEDIERSTASKLADHTLDLVALAITDEARRKGSGLSSARSIALNRLKAVIAERLHDPDIKPATIASAARLSIRYANELLSDEGMSIERYIVAKRLHRCRLALVDPGHAGRTISDIAYGWGFSDPSHFGRRFKAEYGLSPRDYRRQALQWSA